MRLSQPKEFLTQTALALQQARSARSFLPSFPVLLQKYFPCRRCILYYKDAEGNVFRPYSGDGKETGLPLISEAANLIESFTGRSEFLLADTQNRMYFDLFNRDSDDFFAKNSLNLVIPLHARKYFRGLLLASMDSADRKSVSVLAAAAQTAALMFIPQIEAEQMEYENDKNYYRLFKFDRLVLLGQMAASLAHEMRTPLTTVLFELATMKKQLPTNEKISSAYETINREIARANQMIESLLVFSKFKDLHIAPIFLREFIERTLREIPTNKIPSRVDVQVQAEKEIQVASDGNRLRQVFINVLFNALEALNNQKNAAIHIRIYSEYKDLPRNIRHIIAITDNGPGIPDAIKDRVLEPFFTTKKEGTGLGLYISYSIMKTLKGDLEIYSSGQGTRVNLILPAR
ncbi:MAG: HAMP domain-containing histidine kinase [Acidobacteria bacterium]|nr:HAMP domain-containing histidine kinase [Acidobacteriota bacterium]MBU4306375.1 HAMP domain-containing histidine kinase [Acidobacteriota bacterium]MCG2810173.1 HAMP domain-containing histidine kinase [Candidatus Aminicenantes bacterium]